MAATVQQLAGSAHLLRSAACLLAGDLATASAGISTFLANYADTAREEDCCLAYAQLAHCVAERQGHAAAEKVVNPLFLSFRFLRVAKESPLRADVCGTGVQQWQPQDRWFCRGVELIRWGLWREV